MAQRPTADFNIDPNITSGTDLANILNRFQDAIDSGNSGASRPAYLAAGGLWVREGDPMRLYLYDGTTDRELYNTTDGLVGASQWIDNDDGIHYVDGVVGIGTAYPNSATPLTVSDNGTMGFEFRPNEGRILFYNRGINDYAPAVLTCSAFDVVDGGLGVTTLQITDDGNCGIGRPDPQARLDVQGPGNSVVAYIGGSGDTSPRRSLAIAGSDNDLTYTLDSTGDGSNGKLAFATNGSQHLTIDNIGRVGIGGTPSRSTKEIEEEAEATLRNWDSKDKKPTKAELIKKLTERNIGGGAAKLQVVGDGYFSGTVNAEKVAIGSGKVDNQELVGSYQVMYPGGAGGGSWFWSGNEQGTYYLKAGGSWGSAIEMMSVDASKIVTFAGTVNSPQFVQNGTPITTTRDLIETFRTLKNAVSDETTVEGIKEALTNSLGGLIEKFEAMQSAATQEIES